jgi:Kef-type K+ transport system membrane component KefB
MNIIHIPPTLLLQEALNQHVLAQFALFLAFILLWTIVVGKLCKLIFKLPTTAGHIIAGIFLGPSLLNIGNWTFFSHPLHLVSHSTNTLYMLVESDLFIAVIFMVSAVLTVPYLLWMAGHETDVNDIFHVGLPALLAGIFGALLPVLCITGTLHIFCAGSWSLMQSIGLGLTLAATSVSIPVAMLFSYNKMHLKSSKATLGAAVIDDIFAVILLSLFMICIHNNLLNGGAKLLFQAQSLLKIGSAFGSIIGVLVLVFLIGYTLIPASIHILKRLHIIHLIAPVATISMLFAYSFVELVGGLAGITGAYFAGLFHRRGDKHHHAQEIIAPFVTSILLPLFLGSIGFQINMQLLSFKEWTLVGLLLLVAVVAKLVGCFVATAMANLAIRDSTNRWSTLESYLFGASMVARGEVGLVVTTILYGTHIFSAQQYAIAIVVIILTTIASPIMLAIGFRYFKEEEAKKIGRLVLSRALFPTLGLARLFHIIVDSIAFTGKFNTVTHIDEGREVVTIEGESLEIILCPEEGVVFEGNHEKIKEIVAVVKKVIADELENISFKQ